MNEIPTPESDNCYHECVLTPSPGNGLIMRSKMRDLERRLTIAREALKKLDNWLMRDAQRKQIIEETLALTAPKP